MITREQAIKDWMDFTEDQAKKILDEFKDKLPKEKKAEKV